MSSLSFAEASVQSYNRLMRETNDSTDGLYKYLGSLSDKGQLAVKGLSSAIFQKNNEELGPLSDPTDANVVTLVKSYTEGTDMTAEQVEEAKTWTARMAAQQLTKNKSEGSTCNSTLPPEWAALLKKDG